MRSKANKPTGAARPGARVKPVIDIDVERALVDRHDEIEAKLQEARQSIAHGRVKPLEPLPALLRDARRQGKAAR